MIFNLGFTDEDFDAFMKRFVAAAMAMHNDGWWWVAPTQTNKTVRRSVALEILRTRLK
jgi:glutamate-1-semialdehyde 2,1-aminomutase